MNLVVFINRIPPDGLSANSGDHRECEPPTTPSLEEMRRRHSCGSVGDLVNLRSLAERFPALEITLVARAMGAFVTTAYDPAAEAEQVRRWLFDGLQVPGVLVVADGPIRRRPAPDRRLSYLPNENEKTWPNAAAFLIDRDGTIVSANGIPSADVVEALLRQPPHASP